MPTEKIEVSACCRAESWEMYNSKLHRCGKCLKRCEVVEVCGICFGTGVEIVGEVDPDSHQVTHGTGERKCICQLKKYEDEN